MQKAAVHFGEIVGSFIKYTDCIVNKGNHGENMQECL